MRCGMDAMSVGWEEGSWVKRTCVSLRLVVFGIHISPTPAKFKVS